MGTLPTLCSGSTIMRWVSRGASVRGLRASTTKGPTSNNTSALTVQLLSVLEADRQETYRWRCLWQEAKHKNCQS